MRQTILNDFYLWKRVFAHTPVESTQKHHFPLRSRTSSNPVARAVPTCLLWKWKKHGWHVKNNTTVKFVTQIGKHHNRLLSLMWRHCPMARIRL